MESNSDTWGNPVTGENQDCDQVFWSHSHDYDHNYEQWVIDRILKVPFTKKKPDFNILLMYFKIFGNFKL